MKCLCMLPNRISSHRFFKPLFDLFAFFGEGAGINGVDTADNDDAAAANLDQ